MNFLLHAKLGTVLWPSTCAWTVAASAVVYDTNIKNRKLRGRAPNAGSVFRPFNRHFTYEVKKVWHGQSRLCVVPFLLLDRVRLHRRIYTWPELYRARSGRLAGMTVRFRHLELEGLK